MRVRKIVEASHDFAIEAPAGPVSTLPEVPPGTGKMMKRQNHPGEIPALDFALAQGHGDKGDVRPQSAQRGGAATNKG
jgi:hypothetical protein